MSIPVEFKDGMQGEVPAPVLDRLIELNLIARFRRQAGWVDLKSDRVRRRPPVISLPERRIVMQQIPDPVANLQNNESYT